MKTLFFILLLSACAVHPREYQALSCSIDDIQDAINKTKSGDSVKVPAGHCVWDHGEYLELNSGIKVKGSGVGITKIERSFTTGKFMFHVDCSNGLPIEISNFTLIGKNDAESKDGGIRLNNGCVDFKIHNNQFINFSREGIMVWDKNNVNKKHVKGVIYENEFFMDIFYGHGGYGVNVTDDGIHQSPVIWGSENFVYIEDNYFTGTKHAVASNGSAKYVFRHNTVIDNHFDHHSVDAHGGSHPYYWRGTQAVEIYENYLERNYTAKSFSEIMVRGGEGVIFNNTLVGKVRWPISMKVENFGGPCPDSPTYVLDQPNNIYIWDNENGPVRVVSHCSPLVIEDLHYFLYKRPGYEPYTYPHPLRSIN